LTPKATDALHQYVDVMVAERCREPADDLLTTLVTLEVDGRELTVDDIRNFVVELVAGTR
jgi:cytochrome P450